MMETVPRFAAIRPGTPVELWRDLWAGGVPNAYGVRCC